jgi:hypothetical protein
MDENGADPWGCSYESGTVEQLGWAKQQKARPSHLKAIRRLIEIALTAKSKRQSNRGEK